MRLSSEVDQIDRDKQMRLWMSFHEERQRNYLKHSPHNVELQTQKDERPNWKTTRWKRYIPIRSRNATEHYLNKITVFSDTHIHVCLSSQTINTEIT